MTKQKFYELCVKKTLEIAYLDDESPYYDIAKRLDMSDDDTFDMLQLKLASLGVNTIPVKEPFSSLGWKYMEQILYFVYHHLDDDELLYAFDKFIMSNKSLIDLSDKQQDNVVFNIIFDTMLGMGHNGKTLCRILVDFYLTSRKKGKYTAKILHLAYAFALTSLSLDKIVELKKKYPLKI